MRYSAEALADSICLQLDGDHFKGLFGQHPELARRWMISIATRLATSQQRLVDLLGIQLAHQAARVTIDEAVDGKPPYVQATVAALLGARRPSLNKVVSELRRRRLIDVGYRSITVLDATAQLSQARRSTRS